MEKHNLNNQKQKPVNKKVAESDRSEQSNVEENKFDQNNEIINPNDESDEQQSNKKSKLSPADIRIVNQVKDEYENKYQIVMIGEPASLKARNNGPLWLDVKDETVWFKEDKIAILIYKSGIAARAEPNMQVDKMIHKFISDIYGYDILGHIIPKYNKNQLQLQIQYKIWFNKHDSHNTKSDLLIDNANWYIDENETPIQMVIGPKRLLEEQDGELQVAHWINGKTIWQKIDLSEKGILVQLKKNGKKKNGPWLKSEFERMMSMNLAEYENALMDKSMKEVQLYTLGHSWDPENWLAMIIQIDNNEVVSGEYSNVKILMTDIMRYVIHKLPNDLAKRYGPPRIAPLEPGKYDIRDIWWPSKAWAKEAYPDIEKPYKCNIWLMLSDIDPHSEEFIGGRLNDAQIMYLVDIDYDIRNATGYKEYSLQTNSWKINSIDMFAKDKNEEVRDKNNQDPIANMSDYECNLTFKERKQRAEQLALKYETEIEECNYELNLMSLEKERLDKLKDYIQISKNNENILNERWKENSENHKKINGRKEMLELMYEVRMAEMKICNKTQEYFINEEIEFNEHRARWIQFKIAKKEAFKEMLSNIKLLDDAKQVYNTKDIAEYLKQKRIEKMQQAKQNNIEMNDENEKKYEQQNNENKQQISVRREETKEKELDTSSKTGSAETNGAANEQQRYENRQAYMKWAEYSKKNIDECNYTVSYIENMHPNGAYIQTQQWILSKNGSENDKLKNENQQQIKDEQKSSMNKPPIEKEMINNGNNGMSGNEISKQLTQKEQIMKCNQKYRISEESMQTESSAPGTKHVKVRSARNQANNQKSNKHKDYLKGSAMSKNNQMKLKKESVTDEDVIDKIKVHLPKLPGNVIRPPEIVRQMKEEKYYNKWQVMPEPGMHEGEESVSEDDLNDDSDKDANEDANKNKEGEQLKSEMRKENKSQYSKRKQ